MSIILISTPVFAYVTNSSHCDNDVLSTYSGSANLTANWQGNNISVTWYNDDTQYASNSCTYGGNLTMPSSIPQKTGYTFKGWRARQATNYLCGLTKNQVTQETSGWWGNGNSYRLKWYSDGTPYCREVIYQGNGSDENEGAALCSNSAFSDLNVNEWKVEFNHGTFKGVGVCSETGPSYETTMAHWNEMEVASEALVAEKGEENVTLNDYLDLYAIVYAAPSATSSSVTPSNNGRHCWCHAESYTPNGGTQCSLVSLPWRYDSDTAGGYNTPADCAQQCVQTCAYMVWYEMATPYRVVLVLGTGN